MPYCHCHPKCTVPPSPSATTLSISSPCSTLSLTSSRRHHHSLLRRHHVPQHSQPRRRRRHRRFAGAAGQACPGSDEGAWLLPPLSDESTSKEVEFIMSKGWVPCLEFDKEGEIHRSNSRMPGYYDGRYWTLWKLPMFGCSDAAAVLREVEECRREYPDAFIRLIAFDSSRQCQCMSFVVHKPPSAAAASPATVAGAE